MDNNNELDLEDNGIGDDFSHLGIDYEFDDMDEQTGDDNDTTAQEQQAAPQGSTEQQAQAGSDEVFDGLSAMLKNYGIEDFDIEQYKGKGLTEEQAKAVFMQAAEYNAIKKVNPTAATAMRYGINPEAYAQQAAQVENMLKLDDANLGKSVLYNQIYKSEYELGTLPEDPKAAQDHVVALVEERAAKMGEKLTALGANQRKGYEQYKAELPTKMQQAQAQLIGKQMEEHNKTVEQFIARTDISKYIDTGGVIPYGDKSEKDDFAKYVKEHLVADKDKGTSKLMERLRNPSDAMNILRLLHVIDKGGIKDIEKKVTKQVLGKLDMFGNRNPGSQSEGGRKMVDTSKPHEYPM